jgi:hypothetical protein
MAVWANISRRVTGLACPNCAGPIGRTKPIAGVLYVMKNAHQAGVKIGITSKTVAQRARALSGTGVIGRYEVCAVFACRNPKRDERKIHERLKGKRIEKEHFLLEPAEAISKIHTILKNAPMEIDKKVKIAYEQIRAENKKIASIRLNRKKSEPQLRLAI